MSKKKSRIKPAGPVKSAAMPAPQQGGVPDPQEINRLMELFDVGRYEEAEIVADAMTARFPRFGFGWKVLGVLLCQMGRNADAIAPMQKAATLLPGDPEAYFNLGNILKDLGRFDEAVASYRKALTIKLDYAEAYSNLGAALQGLGRLDDAVASHRRALALLPGSAGAHFNLGNVLNDLGRFDDAVTSYRRALEIEPGFAAAHFNLGTALQGVGQIDEAMASCQRALAIAPDDAEAHCKLGDILKGLGRSDEAVASYRRALAIQPYYVEAHLNQGAALQDLGRHDDAMASYRRALVIRPGFAEAHYNLGNALQDIGRPDDAMASYRRALVIRPGFAEAHHNLGNALLNLGRLDEAMTNFHRALESKPDFAEAHLSVGSILNNIGQVDAAVASYRRALEIKPDYAEANNNLGVSLEELSQIEAAEASYRRALTMKPDYAAAHSNLGRALQELGRVDEAVASYRRALAIKPDLAIARGNLLFTLAYHAMVPAAEILTEARCWQTQVLPATATAAARLREFHLPPRAGRRLRVGYVSGDFRQHPVSYFVEPLFRLHDRSRVELFAYMASSKRDEVTDKLQGLADHWQPLAGLSDEAARQRIEADAIDVLIDLSGHTEHNRLGVFALRAAPVQAHYLGYFATTGLTEMDYWLGDPVILPEAEDAHYSETIWRLPRVWLSYQGRDDAPSPAWHPGEDGRVWLGSFNNLKKLTPATLALWAKLLHAIPEARLFLKTKGLADPANRKRMEDEMAALGIGPERLDLVGKTDDWISHMALYDRMDIALDPVGGVGGGTTTCDALWMGVPVVTLAGQQMIHRMTASMLDAIGRPEWIAETESEYVSKVVALARDVDGRRNLRSTQRDRMRSSPLCDAEGLARSLEDAYEAMFDAWWQKRPDAIGKDQPC